MSAGKICQMKNARRCANAASNAAVNGSVKAASGGGTTAQGSATKIPDNAVNVAPEVDPVAVAETPVRGERRRLPRNQLAYVNKPQNCDA